MTKFNFNNFLDVYKKICVYFLYFIPIVLITGPFLPDLFLSLIGIFFIIYSIKNKLFSYYKNAFVYVFVFFYFYLVFRSLLSEDILYSMRSSLFYFRYLFFSLGVYYLFDHYPNLARNLGLSIFFTLIIVSLDGYYQWIFGENIFGWSLNNKDRLAGFFKDEKILGGYLARLTPVLMGLLVFHYNNINKKKLYIGIIFMIFINVLIFGSGERSSFFFITLFLVMLCLLSNNFKLPSFIVLFISTLLIVLITFNNSESNKKVVHTINQISSNTIIPLAPYSPLHEQHYIVALKMFNDNILFGQGPNMFDALCQKEKFNYKKGCTSHPHNSYIQLLAETGIIGFSFLLFAFLIISIVLARQFLGKIIFFNYKLPNYIIFLMISLFTMTWPFIPTGSFFNNWTNVMYYLPVGFVLHYFYKTKFDVKKI